MTPRLWRNTIPGRCPGSHERRRLWRYLAADFTGNLSRRGETDLDRRIWFLRIHDYRLCRLHFDELVFDVFHGLQGKFLIFSHFKLLAPAPGINESGHGLRRGGHLSLHQRDLGVTLRMFKEQLRYILVDAVPIACAFFRELDDLEVSAADDVADFQELCRLALVDGVDAEFVFYPR